MLTVGLHVYWQSKSPHNTMHSLRSSEMNANISKGKIFSYVYYIKTNQER